MLMACHDAYIGISVVKELKGSWCFFLSLSNFHSATANIPGTDPVYFVGEGGFPWSLYIPYKSEVVVMDIQLTYNWGLADAVRMCNHFRGNFKAYEEKCTSVGMSTIISI